MGTSAGSNQANEPIYQGLMFLIVSDYTAFV